MSAAEKLKALAARDDWPYPDGPDDPQTPLLRALPQTVAVVEEAERIVSYGRYSVESGIVRGFAQSDLERALAALDEALK